MVYFIRAVALIISAAAVTACAFVLVRAAEGSSVVLEYLMGTIGWSMTTYLLATIAINTAPDVPDAPGKPKKVNVFSLGPDDLKTH